MQLTPDQEQLWRIFHPYAAALQATVLSQGTRFVHYTLAEAAMKILRNKDLRLRRWRRRIVALDIIGCRQRRDRTVSSSFCFISAFAIRKAAELGFAPMCSGLEQVAYAPTNT
jgi:hypothetical protein